MNKVPNDTAVPSAVPTPSEPLECTGRSEPAQSAAPFLLPQPAASPLVMDVTVAGGLAGAIVATRLVERFGPARVLLTGFLAYAVCGVPFLVARPGPVWLGVIATADALRAAAAVTAGTTQWSLQQLCPSELQSRAQQTSVSLGTGLRPAAGPSMPR